MSKLIGNIRKSNNLVGNLQSGTEINVNIVGSGAKGEAGHSAYEQWLSLGHEGTMQDFFESLASQYIHPEEHSADMITENENRVFLSTQEKEIALTTYIHNQTISSGLWVVIHNLDKYPSVSVVDSSGNVVTGSIEYTSASQLAISFTSEFSGMAYLN